jgi:DNA-binding beta-propeller fold protein YncE
MRLMAAAAALFLSSAPLGAQVEIRSLTGIIEGHEVGGVTIDMIGNVYVADFGDVVWQVTPEGQRTLFVSGLYGTSGNAIDNQGNLLQASFYADAIARVDRNGRAKPFVTGQVSRPAGIAVDRQTGDLYVTSCSGNSVMKVTRDGTGQSARRERSCKESRRGRRSPCRYPPDTWTSGRRPFLPA